MVVKKHFSQLPKNRMNFAKAMLDDENLLKCVAIDEPDFLDRELPCSKENCLFKNIYPCKYVPDIQDTARTYITMGFKYEQDDDRYNYFKAGYVTFYIFCHKDLIQTSYGILRYDYALQRIDEFMNGARAKEWLGDMILSEMDDISVDTYGTYIGVSVTYMSVEWM